MSYESVRRAGGLRDPAARVRKLRELLEKLDTHTEEAFAGLDGLYANWKGSAELPRVRLVFMERVNELRREIENALDSSRRAAQS